MQLNFKESNHMLFSSDVTLIQRTYITVVAALFNQETVCSNIKCILLAGRKVYSFDAIVKQVVSRVDQLDLPDTLKSGLKNLIPVIGWKILHWISITKYSYLLASTYNKLPLNVCLIWTGKGTFDFIRTAKATISMNPSNNVLCYSLASLFCIEETLSNPDAGAHIEYISMLCKFLRGAKSLPDFLEFWKGNLKSGTVNFDTILTPDRSEKGYNLAKTIKCVPVLKYFFDRLSPEKKLRVIRESVHTAHMYPEDGNMLLFLFSKLPVSDVNEVICKYTYNTLKCFIEWPHQECFMPVANSYWNCLSKNEYKGLFFEIAGKVSDFQPSFVYIKLFQEFQHASPSEFKEYFINECLSGKVFGDLLLMKDTNDIVQMILNDCSAEQRQQIIFHPETIDMCDVLTVYELWDKLKFFVLSCIPSTLVLENFVVHVKNHVPHFQTPNRELRNAIFLDKIKHWYYNAA